MDEEKMIVIYARGIEKPLPATVYELSDVERISVQRLIKEKSEGLRPGTEIKRIYDSLMDKFGISDSE